MAMQTTMQTSLSRRTFVAGAAAVAGSALLAAPALAGVPETWDLETDVLCLGAGATGLTAALWAVYSGAEALVLEKGVSALDSCSALADGQLAIGGSSVQKEQGIEDSPEKYYEWVESIQPIQQVADSDLETSKAVCEASAPVFEWLLSLGTQVYGDLQDFLDMGVPRWHTINMRDTMTLLLDECNKQGVEIRYETPATRLIVNADGRVVGAEAQADGKPIAVKARRGVVLGTGGYCGSPEMLMTFNGKKFAGAKPVGCKTNTGDGYTMAMALGAAIRDVHVAPSLALAAADTLVGIVQLPRAGGILVNDKAERYTAENIGASPEAAATSLQGGKTFIIHDDPQMSMEHASITLNRHDVLGGTIYDADTIEELAEKIGLDPAALKATVDTYNGYCEAGHDPDFGRDTIDELEGSAPAPALVTPPFHAIEVCAAIYPTQMRLNSDAKAQVRNTYGEVIPGLYAGGLMGNIGIRNPNSGQVAPALTGAFALGYIAGQEAAAQEPWE